MLDAPFEIANTSLALTTIDDYIFPSESASKVWMLREDPDEAVLAFETTGDFDLPGAEQFTIHRNTES